MKFWPKMSALSLYSSIVKVKKYSRYYLKNLLKKQKRVVVKEVYVEDLPALIYIHHRITGIEIGQKFHHVVIDEAQDFSPFKFMY